MDSAVEPFQLRPISIKPCPPSQSTRIMLVERMTKNLTTPSVLSRKYGLLIGKRPKKIQGIWRNHHILLQISTMKRSQTVTEVLLYRCMLKSRVSLCWKSSEECLRRKWLENYLCLKRLTGQRRQYLTFLEDEFIDREEAETLLKPLETPGNGYKKICFSIKGFGLDDARVAIPILISLGHQITEVDISDFVAGRNEAEALEVMTIFSSALEVCRLRYLNLSNNALGEKGIRAFGPMLKSLNDLEELYLMNDGISKEAARAVCELLPSTEKLRVLHFHNNMTGDEGAVAISEMIKHSALEDFRCSSNRVASEGGITLYDALKACTHMKKLDLKEVYLSYLNMEDEGAEAIAGALEKSAPSLEVLEMAGNDISVKASATLASCIMAKQFLTKHNPVRK